MRYAINHQSHPETGALRSTARAEHLKRVQQHKDLGQLLVAVPTRPSITSNRATRALPAA